jgi:hypothetical protein
VRLRWMFVVVAIALAISWAVVQRYYNPKGSQLQVAQPESDPVRNAVTHTVPSGDKVRKSKRPPSAGDWFRDVTDETGIRFRHVSGDSKEKPFPSANGSGLAAIDFDLDGYSDLYFATGTAIPIVVTDQSPSNRFYRNLGGWRFDDVTEKCGLGHRGFSAGLAVGDIDADGFPDVYVACYGPNRFYRNLGDGTFEEIGMSAQVADDRWATSAGFMDYDADSLLDLYVCNYGNWTPETNQFCGNHERGVRMFCSPTTIEPQPDVLYRNTGDGLFEDATDKSGVGVRRARAQGIVAADVTNDGLVDIYVGNDLHPNCLFINLGGGHFRDASEDSGTAYDAKGNSQAGMGVDIADANGDGQFDVFVTNFQNENNCLYENLGGEFFRETSFNCGLAADSIPWVGWGTVFADFDFDGWLDVVVTNGHVDDNRHLLGQDAPYYQPGLLWKNIRGQFKRIDSEAGDYFSVDHAGRGLILVDLDNDGDQDLGISHQDEKPALLINQVGNVNESRSVVVRLVGTTSNRDAVGSLVTFRSGARTVVAQVKGGGSYLSASELRLFFAVLPEENEFTIEVRWPDGHTSVLRGLEQGQEYVIVQNNSHDASTIPMKEASK